MPFSGAKLKAILASAKKFSFRRDQVIELLKQFNIAYERRYLLLNGLFEATIDGPYVLDELLRTLFDFEIERTRIRADLRAAGLSTTTQRPLSAISSSSSSSSTSETPVMVPIIGTNL